MLQHLRNGWQVDQAILSEEDRVVVSVDCRFKNNPMLVIGVLCGSIMAC